MICSQKRGSPLTLWIRRDRHHCMHTYTYIYRLILYMFVIHAFLLWYNVSTVYLIPLKLPGHICLPAQ